MILIVKVIELLCFLILTLLGALVIGLGVVLSCPGIVVSRIGQWIGRLGRMFE